MFDSVECRASNREFNTVTGSYRGKRMSVLSTGIGIGNIDICVTELDALANVDFATRTVRERKRRLNLVRLGTSGALQPDISVGEVVYSATSVGFDGLLNFYEGRNDVCDLDIERAFMRHTGWSDLLPKPYFVDSDPELEGSALAGLAALMGHRATTMCTVIAQRIVEDACTDYKPFVERMIGMALDNLASARF